MEELMMKKYILPILFCIAIAAGCKKENAADTPSAPESGMTFTASIEDCKTILTSEDKLNWEAGDFISVNGILFAPEIDGTDPSKAVFSKADAKDPDPEAIDGKFYAYYPASIWAGGSEQPVLPAVQNYGGASVAGVNPMYAVADGAGRFEFKNICGLLEIRLTGKGAVSSITVGDEGSGMSGKFTVDENGNAVICDEAKAAGTTATLSCAQPVALSGTIQKFYVAVPSGEYNALSIKVYDADGKLFAPKLKTGTTASIARNTIYPITLAAEFKADDVLSGIYSVGTGRQVRFAAGNLYFENGSYGIEEKQNECSYKENHTTLFTWEEMETFCTDNKDGWKVLDSDGWNYLLTGRTMLTPGAARYTNTVKEPVTIEGVGCAGLFIYPDNYAGEEVSGSFTWADIRSSGIVFLPSAGFKTAEVLKGSGRYGYYWSTGYDQTEELFFNVKFSANGTAAFNAYAAFAEYAVRPVREAE